MISPRIKTLESGLSGLVAPALKGADFAFDKRRRTFRRKVGGCTQIVYFQVGGRTMEGLFTVDLGVYHSIYREDSSSRAPEFPEVCHCLVRERLSVLRDTAITRLFPAWFRKSENVLKRWLSTPMDLWWKFNEDSENTLSSLSKALELFQSSRIPWFDANTQEAGLRQVHEEMQCRIGKI